MNTEWNERRMPDANKVYRQPSNVMSNYDGEIDFAVATLLKETISYAGYPGANFFGRVWWDTEIERWSCEVWVHKSWRRTVSATRLEDVMSVVCGAYGVA